MSPSWIPPEPEQLLDTSPTWMRYDVFQRVMFASGPEGWIVKAATNDDNDDGWPDGHIETWEFQFPTLEAALDHTGVTRRGFYGHPVEVYLYGDLNSGRLPVNEGNRQELLDKYGKV
jgi:hypothetical protein